ncbi:MAG: 50S ribosomal protein L29 [Christensenellales bacterium]|jgi:large subunit ribosomal protein L29
MKNKQLYELTTEELSAKLNELKNQLFFLRFKHATNQLTNANVLVECKRDIARVKTILRQRELNIYPELNRPASKKKAK